jgi:hypothetical protein
MLRLQAAAAAAAGCGTGCRQLRPQAAAALAGCRRTGSLPLQAAAAGCYLKAPPGRRLHLHHQMSHHKSVCSYTTRH